MPEVGDWVLLDVRAFDGEVDHQRGEIEAIQGRTVVLSYLGVLESKTIKVNKADLVRPSKTEIHSRLLVVAAPVWKLKNVIDGD